MTMRAQVKARPAAAFVKKCLEPTVTPGVAPHPPRPGALSGLWRAPAGLAAGGTAPCTPPPDPRHACQVNELPSARRGAVSDGLPGAGTAAPKAEQRIYFANHQSHADMVLIWAALPEELRSITRPIAAKDYWTKTPSSSGSPPRCSTRCMWTGKPALRARQPRPRRLQATPPGAGQRSRNRRPGGPDPAPEPAAPPSPEAPGAALPESDPLAPLVRALESGDSIVIFPEGTRGHGDEPQPFKSGLYKLAQMFPNVVLVPAWINNVQRVMPKGEVVPVPILCSVTFGAPIALEPGEERRPFSTVPAAR